MQSSAMISVAHPPQRGRRLTVVALVAAVVVFSVVSSTSSRRAFVVPGFAPVQHARATVPGFAAFPSSNPAYDPWVQEPAFRTPRGMPDPIMAAARIRTNDYVKVLSGDAKGETGKVLRIDSKKEMVVVEGVNIRSKHVKPMKEGESGSIVKKEMPIHMSKVAVVDNPAPEAPEPVAALAVFGEPVMRIRGRSWIPFMNEATEDADEVAEEVDEEAVDDEPKRKPKKKDVSVWSDADPNDYISGTVRSVMPYGAFVTLSDGNDGLLHVSQMSDEFTSDPNEIVKEGDEVQVRVIKVDLEKNQVALSMKDPSKQRPPRQQNRGPRVDKSQKAEAYKELAANADDKVFVPGTVSSVTDFGAFVKLEEGVEGLVHISQIKDGYLGSVADELTVGDEVKVRVQSVDTAKQKISLSMLEWKEKGENDRSDRKQRSSGPSLGFGPDFEEKASTEELAAISVGFDEAAPSWFDVALEREEMKKAKKAAGEKYLITP